MLTLKNNACERYKGLNIYLRPVVAQGHKGVPVNRLVVGSIPTRGESRSELFIYIYIFSSLLWCRGESGALSSATQCFQKLA